MSHSLTDIFGTVKPVIGMIHLAGNPTERIDRAILEIKLYEEEGLHGAIVEDYHGSPQDVITVFRELKNPKITLGINILRDSCYSFELAFHFGAKFVQFDSVQTEHIETANYDTLRNIYSNVAVLGGVRFKYQKPTGKSLEEDLRESVPSCDVVVTTGEGTGKETPLKKLREFRSVLGSYPLFSGAGVTTNNVREQMSIADGVIVGSYFKRENTEGNIERGLVRDLMSIVKTL